MIDPIALLCEALGPLGGVPQIQLRRTPDAWSDATVFSHAPSRVARLLAELPGDAAIVHEVLQLPKMVEIRFTDEFVAVAGDELRRSAGECLRPAAASLPRAVVSFCDPNATKALHIGHLRNLAVGDALATLLFQGGADVIRQSVVCDVGRAVAEAVAGYMSYHSAGDPRALGMRPDAFVGECYAAYQARGSTDSSDEPDPDARLSASARCAETDAAAHILRALRDNEPRMTEIWSRLLGWVLEGHQRTFDRLGIAFNHYIFERDSLHRLTAVARRAISAGVFEQNPDGSVDMIGRAPFEGRVPMIRSDGLETGYMRHFAIWYDMQQECTAPTQCINVTGAEWYTTGRIREASLSALGPCPLYDNYHRLTVGMVHSDGGVMKSRDGKAPLIEDHLDVVSDRLRNLQWTNFHDTDEHAGVILKCSVLAPPVSKPMIFTFERLCDARVHPGWNILRAYLESERSAAEGPAGVSTPRDPGYRYAVLRAYELAVIRQVAIDSYEPTLVLKFMSALAKWYLAAPRSSSVASVVRSTLSIAGTSIGLFKDRTA
ncbi:MAG TPA: arginine--tRNA ligase [Conexibacter sp.]|nr:arginine--tRNA ligase [Conexibacter sp.]